MIVGHSIPQSLKFINTLPLSRYDLNNVERDVKHQTIIIMLWYSLEVPLPGSFNEYL